MGNNPNFARRISENMALLSKKGYCTFIEKEVDIHWSWRDLELHCNWVRVQLSDQESGVALIFLKDMRQMHAAYYGCMLSGLIPSFMPCTSPKQDASIYWKSHISLLKHISPVAVITTTEFEMEMRDSGLQLKDIKIIHMENMEAHEFDGTIHARGSEDVVLLQHSSGTTGLKKGVALSNKAVAFHAERYGESLSVGEDDVVGSWLPLYHDMGLMACMLMPAYLGIPIVQMDPFRWVAAPDKFLNVLESYQATLVWMPNFAFELYARIGDLFRINPDLSKIRGMISCSEVSKFETLTKFEKIFLKWNGEPDALQTCYAMAETVFAATQTKLNSEVKKICFDPESLSEGECVKIAEKGRFLVSCGTQIDGIEIEIFDQSRNMLDPGFIGEIGIKGEQLFEGYFGLEKSSMNRFHDGFFMTRDVGFKFDDELFVLGRLDDMIIINGRNIYAHDVEALLLDINGLKRGRSVAFGVDDADSGSQNLVVISERSGSDLEREGEIKREIREVIESTIGVVPGATHIVDRGWLVKTSSGKVGRKENREKYLSELFRK